MPLLYSCECFSISNTFLPIRIAVVEYSATQNRACLSSPKIPSAKTPNFISKSFNNLTFPSNFPVLRRARVAFCSKNDVFEDLNGIQENPEIEDFEELNLLGKPSPRPVNNMPVAETEDEVMDKPNRDEVLEDFLKFFRASDSLQQDSDLEEGRKEIEIAEEVREKVSVEYYEPKPGDLVVGTVVSGNENRLDVNVGADLLGTMLTKEVLPLYHKEVNYLLCDVEKDAEDFMVNGKVGIVKNDEAVSGEAMPGRPVVEHGTILFAEVLGRTLSGRPLLSTRRLFRRLAWHRVRQVLFSPSVVPLK